MQSSVEWTYTTLARYRLFKFAGQILQNLLLALLDFEQNWLGHSHIVLH